MIGYLRGNLISYSDGTVLLEVNGVGYEISCSSSVYAKLINDKGGEVFTYMAVREDGVYLYGFLDQEEKNMFLKLISVSGVGPKMGITILSGMRLSDLAIKIASNDVKGLSQVKGLGKKTAERIILELREKITSEDVPEVSKEVSTEITKSDEDAIIALMSLGFTKAECVKVIKDAKQEGEMSLEQLIAYSLKHIK